MHQPITCYIDALQVVKVWDLHTGSKVFEFSVGSCEISCMDIDESGKRYKAQNTILCVRVCEWHGAVE